MYAIRSYYERSGPATAVVVILVVFNAVQDQVVFLAMGQQADLVFEVV